MKALDKEGLDYLANKVYDAINSGGSADYIVEEGTMLSSDNVSWTYRKWASGIAECWGKDTNHTSIAGSASNVTYLPNIFYTAPIATLSQSTTTIADSWVKYARVPATPSNGSYYINWYVYASAGDKSIELMIDVKGFWKEFTPSVSGSTYSPIDLQSLNANALQYKKCSALNITNTNNLLSNGIYSGYSMTNAPQTGWMLYLVLLHDSNSQYIEQIAFPVGAPAKFWRRTLNGANNWSAWNVYNQN